MAVKQLILRATSTTQNFLAHQGRLVIFFVADVMTLRLLIQSRLDRTTGAVPLGLGLGRPAGVPRGVPSCVGGVCV